MQNLRDGAQFFEVGLGDVPLLVRKATNFSTIENQMVNKGVKVFRKLTAQFLPFIRVFYRSRFGEVVNII
jgi:hypothetical protein